MAGVKIDGAAPAGASREYPQDLYTAEKVAAPLHGLAAVGESEVQQYRELGYLAVEDVFSTEEVEAAKEGFRHLVAGGNPDYDGLYFESFAADSIDALDGEAKLDAIRKLAYYVEYEPRLKALSHHPRLLPIVSKLLGVQAEPWMFQDMGMLKPPGGREKPWHQDKAYFDFAPDTPVVGVWVALDEVVPENGCMFVLEGAHRAGPVVHFMRRDWQICDTDVKQMPWDAVAVPLKPGGCLFFDGLIPHGTPANNSAKRRWACQFHYAPQSTQKVSTEARMAVFGSEGKDVSC